MNQINGEYVEIASGISWQDRVRVVIGGNIIPVTRVSNRLEAMIEFICKYLYENETITCKREDAVIFNRRK